MSATNDWIEAVKKACEDSYGGTPPQETISKADLKGEALKEFETLEEEASDPTADPDDVDPDTQPWADKFVVDGKTVYVVGRASTDMGDYTIALFDEQGQRIASGWSTERAGFSWS